MAVFRYRAIDRDGTSQSGEVEASNVDEARGRLLERGWTTQAIAIADSNLGQRLSAEESNELMQHVSRLASGGLPLGAGLRAAAAESDRLRVQSALRTLADRIDRGESLGDILQTTGEWLPSHIAGLISTALRTGRLAPALVELMEQQRRAQRLRQRVRQALAYPVAVAIVAALLLAAITLLMTASFERLFADFEIELPIATRHVIWWRDTGIWVLLAVVVLTIVAGMVFRRVRGPAAWARLLSAFPLFGPLFHLRAVAEWAGLMSVLMKNQVPLPDALQWSADGVSNPWVAQTSRMWAKEASSGQNLSTLLVHTKRLPNTLAPFIQWGEKNGVLADAFAAGRELLDRRVETRAELLKTVLPPLLFVAIASEVLLLLFAIFAPIVNLISGLS